MKTIHGFVKCQGWERPEPFDVEVPDDATEDQVEEAMRDAAAEAAKFEFWSE